MSDTVFLVKVFFLHTNNQHSFFLLHISSYINCDKEYPWELFIRTSTHRGWLHYTVLLRAIWVDLNRLLRVPPFLLRGRPSAGCQIIHLHGWRICSATAGLITIWQNLLPLQKITNSTVKYLKYQNKKQRFTRKPEEPTMAKQTVVWT